MSSGILYEPRSFWSIENIDPQDVNFDNGQPTRRLMERRHFYNGEDYPIQITRLAMCIVNPSMWEGTAAIGVQEGATSVHLVRIAASFPQRFHLSQNFVVCPGVTPRPTWAPRWATPNYAPGGFEASSLWGQSVLKLDKPLMLPRKGSITWGLSAISPWATVAEAQTEQAIATLLYQQRGALGGGDLWPGSARSVTFPIEIFDDTSTQNLGQRQTDERWPFLPDSAYTPGAANAGQQNWWPPGSEFNAQEFDRQESTRAGSTEITDLRAVIDQRAADLELQTAFGTTFAPAPYSLRLGTRIRTVNGGSKQWWWRPGAPMALVFDRITPANVYHFPQPVTLPPGEQVNIEIEFPQPVPAGKGFVYPPTGFHIGVALNGYAAIEG